MYLKSLIVFGIQLPRHTAVKMPTWTPVIILYTTVQTNSYITTFMFTT